MHTRRIRTLGYTLVISLPHVPREATHPMCGMTVGIESAGASALTLERD